MQTWFETVTDLVSGAEVLRARRYGVIEVAGEALRAVRLRPFPKLATYWGTCLARHCPAVRGSGNRCRLYYNQPRRYPWCLTLQYVESTHDASFRTARLAVDTLDAIARIKGIDTLLCDVSNARISDRLLARWGWQPHAPMPWHRNYVKRLYELQLPASTPAGIGCPRTPLASLGQPLAV